MMKDFDLRRISGLSLMKDLDLRRIPGLSLWFIMKRSNSNHTHVCMHFDLPNTLVRQGKSYRHQLTCNIGLNYRSCMLCNISNIYNIIMHLVTITKIVQSTAAIFTIPFKNTFTVKKDTSRKHYQVSVTKCKV